MKHTSGPWIVIEGGPLEGDTVITTQERINGDIIPIVDMDTDYEGEIGIEQEANAKLIAAAPERLESAKRAYNFMLNTQREYGIADDSDQEFETTKLLRAAIAKATE